MLPLYLKKSSFHHYTKPVENYIWLDRLKKSCEKASEQWTDYQRPLEAILDFRFPKEWFPSARLLKPRKIYCHVGPTNSGKTYSAIQKLKQAERGVYCAPLRLLAMEMWEKLNAEGKQCALRTGEITAGPVDDLNADLNKVGTLSCTVEMLDLGREFDVAIIDEIQMIADEQRGWAFTQALLGVNAKEIYLCGEEASISLIQRIISQLGDQMEIVKYDRLSPLIVAPKSLKGRLDDLQPGDCVVAFSRKRIFQTKYLIELKTGKKCAVVYGNLPMENRTLQAKAFNERIQGVDIMVASDAIGMGLNLNIQRIIFHEVKQPSQEGLRLVPPSRIKQIAGRAGRFGFGSSQGMVTCLHEEDMEYLHECMATPNEEYNTAGLAPPASIIEEISNSFPDLPLVSILSAITTVGRYSKEFSPCISKEQKLLAHILEEFPSLSIRERLTLSSAPVQLKNLQNVTTFQWFMKCLSTRKECPMRIDLGQHRHAMDYLSLAESFYRTLDLYLWLASRFPDTFIDRSAVMMKREKCSQLVTKLLLQITVDKSDHERLKQISFNFDKAEAKAKAAIVVEQPEIDLNSLDEMIQDMDSKI